MWEIYDRLIEPIPEELVIEDIAVCLHWTYVRSKNIGIVMTFKDGCKYSKLPGKIKGMKVKELAEYVKSWNFFEAGIGLAALNSYYNTVENVERLKGIYESDKGNNAFDEYREEIKGKKVTVVGHFPNVEALKDICELSILERMPSPGDYPDSACEYILKEQDYLFITGTTITNKTLPRLLELGSNSRVILVGPSVPLSPVLFEYGVDVLASTVASDDKRLINIIKEGGWTNIFENGGKMVRVVK